MPVLTLPPSFANSFWSQGYRRGLEVLYDKLEQGLAENLEIFNFIKARALVEDDTASSLLAPSPAGNRGYGFDRDDGASLYMAFRTLQTESVRQGEAHKAVAHELTVLVADPFGEWAAEHADRVQESRKVIIEGWLKAYEMAIGNVEKLKSNYITKSRRADEAEDDAKFAPGSNVKDKYTNSRRIEPSGGVVKRTASVSERIAQRLKELRGNVPGDNATSEPKLLSPGSPVFSAGKSDGDNEHIIEDIPAVSSKDKGKGKEIQISASPTNLSPQRVSLPLPLPSVVIPKSSSPMPPSPPSPITLAGVSLPPQAVSQLFSRAASELPLRSVRFPILGEYQDCFSGEEFATWLKESVEGFGGSLDRAEDAARELTERENLLRRIGELGNKFENSKTAFYQFRQRAFEYHLSQEAEPLEQQGALSPVAENLLKRTNTFVSMVSKAVSANNPSEPPHVRARNQAHDADKQYRSAVRRLDRQRLGLEQKIEETLKTLQRWETDRLRAVKIVLLQYQGTLANLSPALSSSLDRSSVVISSYQPENDLIALIERYRTGPFRPASQNYESVSHDRFDIVFGMDLRKWAGEGGWHAIRAKDDQKERDEEDCVPNVVKGLLAGLNEAYRKLPNDIERRKTWIYDVPLPAVHHLREVINTLPLGAPLPPDVLAKYDAPVLASTLKLWALELDPPLGLWEGWEDVRKLYPSVGAVAGAEVPEQQRVEDLQIAMLKLPKVHLMVLDAIIGHLKHLIDATHEVDETSEVYITKLGLSFGRSILRPRVESELSIQDRHPTLLFIDLVRHYSEILPKAITRKKRESAERVMPTRKRTMMVDQRLSRSRISIGADPQQLLAAQHAAQRGPPSRANSPTRFSEPPEKPAVSPASPPPSITPAQVAPAAEVPYTPPPRPVFAAETEDSYNSPPRPLFAEAEGESNVPVHPRIIVPGPGKTAEGIATSPPVPSEVCQPEGPSSKTELSTENKSPTGLSRSGSGETRVRGPRTAKPTITRVSPSPRSPPSRASPAASTGPRATHSRGPSANSSPADLAREYAPKKHSGRANAAIFSRRTQASDAEDNVLDK